MTSPRRTAARLLACAAALALALALPTHAAAQEDEEPRRFCTAGRPQPACEMVLVAQFSHYPGIVPSGDLADPVEWEAGILVNRGPDKAPRSLCLFGRPKPACASFVVATLSYFPGDNGRRDDGISWNLLEGEAGIMTNLGSGHAMGLSLALAHEALGNHTSLKGRYRLWLSNGLALDAGAGFTVFRPASGTPRGSSEMLGPTADLTLGLTDWVALTVRGHTLWAAPEGTIAEGQVGVRLGTVPGIIAGILIGLEHLLTMNGPLGFPFSVP